MGNKQDESSNCSNSPRDNFQAMAQVEEIQVEPTGLPELKRWSWESHKTRVPVAYKEKYWSCKEKELQKPKEIPPGVFN